MFMSTTVSWLVYHYCSSPSTSCTCRTAAFILTIATFVQLEEMFIRKTMPVLYRALGIYLPLIVVNCAVLAAAFLAIDYQLDLLRSIVYSLGVSCGYFLALIMLAAIREVVDFAPVPRSFKGYPIAFITASLMSLSFLGFKGLFGL